MSFFAVCAFRLDEQIQHLTLVVDRPPEPVFTAADRNHHFIEVSIGFQI